MLQTSLHILLMAKREKSEMKLTFYIFLKIVRRVYNSNYRVLPPNFDQKV